MRTQSRLSLFVSRSLLGGGAALLGLTIAVTLGSPACSGDRDPGLDGEEERRRDMARPRDAGPPDLNPPPDLTRTAEDLPPVRDLPLVLDLPVTPPNDMPLPPRDLPAPPWDLPAPPWDLPAPPWDLPVPPRDLPLWTDLSITPDLPFPTDLPIPTDLPPWPDLAVPADLPVKPDLPPPPDMPRPSDLSIPWPVADMAFSPRQDVNIYVDNRCNMDVQPRVLDVPPGVPSITVTYYNRSRDYAVDVWLSYGGGFLDLKTGTSWADRFEHCRLGRRPYSAYADITTACSRYRLLINCK
jgi:hypothetical protein